MRIIAALAMLLATSPLQLRGEDARGAAHQPPATPAIFAPGIVSGPGDEHGLTVDRAWSEIHFSRQQGESASIMTARWTSRGWSQPAVASFSGNSIDAHPWLAPDERKVIFVSRRFCPGSREALNVWFVERSGDDWTPAQSMGSPFINQTVHAASVSASRTIYASGLIPFIREDGAYHEAERLGVEGGHPAVSRDETFIVFSARRSAETRDIDLFVVFTDGNGGWTSPRPLGSEVNSNAIESSPTLSADGSTLFFSRHGDIWWVDADVIERAGR